MFNLDALRFGLSMATLDVTAFSIVKQVSLGFNPMWMIIPVCLYAYAPILLLKSLKSETLTVMNVLWDVVSDVLVTLVGLFYFSEKVSWTKLCGVALSIISIVLLTYEG